MFDLNFIADPGIQLENSDACWSFLHKRKTNEEEIAQKKAIVATHTTEPMSKYYTWVICAILLIAGFSLYYKPRQTVSPDMVLNQVVDLIIESGYMKDLQLAEAHFMPKSAIVTISTSIDFCSGIYSGISQGR